MTRPTKVAAAAATILAATAVALPADWPRWRGPTGDGHAPPGGPVLRTLPEKPQVLWRVKIGFGLDSPVVAGGKVFYLDNQRGRETVHARDARTGRQAWSADLDEAFRDNQSAPGPRCTAVADEDRLYVQSCRGEFRCLAVDDGRTLWRVHFVRDFGAEFHGERGAAVGASRHGYCGSPVVEAERIYVGVGGRKGAGVVCFQKRTGKVIWKSQNDIPGYSGPVLATIGGVRQVVSFTAEGVIGLRADDGALLWRVPVRTRLGRHAVTPVVVGQMVIVSSYQAGLMGIRVTKQGDGFRAEQAWVDRGAPVNFASPVAVGGYLYALGRGRALVCVDVRSGKRAWTDETFFSGMIRKGYAGFLAMGDRLLILAEQGQLLLLAADPAGCRRLARTSVCGQNWCTPAWADGRLYLRDAKELICLRLADAGK